MKIGVLEAGPNVKCLADRFGSFTDMFRDWLGPVAPDATFVGYSAYENGLPASVGTCDAYLVTGGAASVLDPLPWIAPLSDFVVTAARDRKIAGICFGHQLLAQAFGGVVERSEKGWGAGVQHYDVVTNGRPAWMAPLCRRVTLGASHQDQVTILPPGAQPLAGNDFCPNAMMLIGENALAVQPHPEFPSDFMAGLLVAVADRYDDDLRATARASLERPIDGAVVASWVWQFLSG